MARHVKDPWAKKAKKGQKIIGGIVDTGVKVGKAATSNIKSPKLSEEEKQKIIENRSAGANLAYTVIFAIIALFALGCAIYYFARGTTFGGVVMILIGLFMCIGVATFYTEYRKKLNN